MGGRVFVTKQFDKKVYTLLQALRVAHEDASQWEILQAAVVAYGARVKAERDVYLESVRLAPVDQPDVFPCRD